MRPRKAKPRPAPARTWPEAVDAFDAQLAAEEKSALTRKNYREDLEAFALWYRKTYEEAPEPARLAAAELREWKADLQSRERKTSLGGTKKLQPSTINRKLSAMKSFLRWAEGSGLSPGIVTPKTMRQTTRPPRWLSRKEQLALLRAVDRAGKVRDVALVALLLNCGLRVAEVVALKWADVDIHERGGEVTVREGKGRKLRRVPANAAARNALIELKALSRGTGAPEIFHGQRGPLTTRGVQATLGKYGKAAGLPDLTPHALRHSFCKNLADKKVRLEMIAALAGHESLETTRRYTEPGREDLAAAVELSGRDD